MPRQFYYAEADSETTATSSTYADKASLAFTPDDNATYYIISSWQQKYGSIGAYGQARLRRTSGTAKTFQDSQFQPNNIADYAAFGGLAIESFGTSPGEQTYKTQVASSDNTNTITTKNHRIFAIRKETGDQDATDDSSSNATGSFQDKLTKTFTPDSTGDYLIIASLDATWVASDFPEIQLLVDSTVHGLVRPDNGGGANRHSWAAVAVVNLDNSSHTLKIQYRRANGTSTVSVANARIIALRLDEGFESYFSDSDPTLVTTTSATYQDRSVVTQTLEAEDYLVLSSQGLRLSNQQTAAALGKLIEDSTDKITARYLSRQPFNESIFAVFTVYKKTFTAASYTLKTQYASQTGGTTIGQRDSVIAIAQLTGGAAATDLVIQSATHSHAAENVVLQPGITLAIQDATHSHTSENVALTQVHNITIQSAIHAHVSGMQGTGGSGGVSVGSYAVGSAAVGGGVTGSALTDIVLEEVEGEAIDLVIQSASHTHSAENLALTQVHELAVQDSSHTHTSESLLLAQVHEIEIAAATHSHTSGNLSLTQVHELAVQSASHAHTAENIVFDAFEQEGFRWRNDDGSETTATWAASQDINTFVNAETPIRLRFVINGSGNPDPAQFRLEYRVAGSSDAWDVVS